MITKNQLLQGKENQDYFYLDKNCMLHVDYPNLHHLYCIDTNYLNSGFFALFDKEDSAIAQRSIGLQYINISPEGDFDINEVLINLNKLEKKLSKQFK